MRFRMVQRLLPALLVTALVVGCEDDPPPPIPGAPGSGSPPGAPGQPAPAGAPPPAGAAPAPAPTAAVMKPDIELAEKDFKEGPNNRDPFRTFMGEFKPIVRKVTQDDRKVILRRFGLDELKLIAVVTGPAVRPRAMFRDPNGLGVSVQRGQRVSKNAAKIKRILRDKIVVEIEEQAEEKITKVDRIIELHPKEEDRSQSEDGQSDDTTPDRPTPAPGTIETPDKPQ